MRKLNAFLKSFILFLRPGLWLGFLAGPFQIVSNTIRLSRWTTRHGSAASFNDFYRPLRNYKLRYDLYEHIARSENLEQAPIDYLEFGVAKGLFFHGGSTKTKTRSHVFMGSIRLKACPKNGEPFPWAPCRLVCRN